jgi:hypothetical protein
MRKANFAYFYFYFGPSLETVASRWMEAEVG